MPTLSRKSGTTRKRLSKSPASKSPDSYRDKIAKNRERELVERAKHNSEVHEQLIELMEEDKDMIEIFEGHLKRQYGDKWNSFNSKQKASKIKDEMIKCRVPVSKSNRKGGKRTKRRLIKSRKSRKSRRTRRTRRR